MQELNQILRLKEEIEKLRQQFYLFAEITKIMRKTLYLDEIAYIILTALTAHQGFSFNRAALFLSEHHHNQLKGFMGIGHIDIEEATKVWQYIEEKKMGLEDLIKVYYNIKEGKMQSKFLEYIRSLAFPLGDKFLQDILKLRNPQHIIIEENKEYENSSFIKKLHLKDFLASTLWVQNHPYGIIVVDNYITKKPISDENLKIFKIFIEQSEGAIANSRIFEDALKNAHTDHLTSLWNYGYFQYKLDEEILKAKTKKLPLSLMMIDIDNFKKLNDTLGHLRGDEVLKKISSILRQTSRKADIVCRYGGEEFSIVLPLTTKEEGYQIGERIKDAVYQENILEKEITVSIGVAELTSLCDDKEKLIAAADNALYKAKREGKNKVIVAE